MEYFDLKSKQVVIFISNICRLQKFPVIETDSLFPLEKKATSEVQVETGSVLANVLSLKTSGTYPGLSLSRF